MLFPEEGTVYDYEFVKEGLGCWEPWSRKLSEMPPLPKARTFVLATYQSVAWQRKACSNFCTRCATSWLTVMCVAVSEFLIHLVLHSTYVPLAFTFTSILLPILLPLSPSSFPSLPPSFPPPSHPSLPHPYFLCPPFLLPSFLSISHSPPPSPPPPHPSPS